MSSSANFRSDAAAISGSRANAGATQSSITQKSESNDPGSCRESTFMEFLPEYRTQYRYAREHIAISPPTVASCRLTRCRFRVGKEKLLAFHTIARNFGLPLG